MIIKLQPTQIEDYWETIKFAAVKADMVKEENVGVYSIDLLFSLLNEESVCLISMGEDRKIRRILILSFYQNEIQNKKIMFFRTLYSFSHGSQDDWKRESAKVYAYAVSEGCKTIHIQTSNPDVVMLANRYGFVAGSQNFFIDL